MKYSAKEIFSSFKKNVNTAIGIDLGTLNYRVWRPGNGITVNQPHVIAVDRANRKVVAMGHEASEMFGRVPESIEVIHPFEQGVISSVSLSESFYRNLFHEQLGKFFLLKPVVMVSVASDATPVEREALTHALFSAGARQVYLIDAPLAAAIGAGVPIAQSSGNIIVHVGAGITEIGVISLGSIMALRSIRTGGENLDQSIKSTMLTEYSLDISRTVSRQLKEQLVDLRQSNRSAKMLVKGKDVVSGYPKEVEVDATKLIISLAIPLKELTEMIQLFLEELPAELSADVIEKGVILTGGGAQLRGLDYCLTQVAGVPVSVAEDPELCVIRGIGVALDNLDLYRQSLAFEGMG